MWPRKFRTSPVLRPLRSVYNVGVSDSTQNQDVCEQTVLELGQTLEQDSSNYRQMKRGLNTHGE